jgi:CheY-like chemotaxis protein
VPQTLLLADDSVTIQRVIELTFADEDIKVVAVNDGDEAIGRIEADPPDIVLVDIGMPGKTGYEVAHHIKQSPRLQHIPVLLLTGAFEPVDQAKATAAGCNGVLAKPFEPQLVITRVRELLGTERREAPAVVADPPPPEPPVSDLWGLPAPAELGHGVPSGTAVRTPQVAHLDQYFADLDAAFATLDTAPAHPAKSDAMLSPVADDWFHMPPDVPAPPPDFNLLTAEPVRQTEPAEAGTDKPAPRIEPAHANDSARQAESREQTGHVPSQTPVAAAALGQPPQSFPVQAEPLPLPPLADAFAAILAAEQHEPMALGHLWPASPVPPAPLAPSANGTPSLGDEAIEAITRQVLDRLSDQIVRETVADLVSHVAERLVREEIERIKATIK